VLVILCLSGGGSRAAWFSAAIMMRLEEVEDRINLLHEVDVISSVSGSSLTAAYYCVTRDPGPYSVIRVEQLPETLPVELAPFVKMDRPRRLLGVRGKMSLDQRNRLLPLFAMERDRECVERLHWLSHHTRAPEIWEPGRVRDVLTRNYTRQIIEASFSPLNLWDDCLYWTTAFDRSDQLAKIFARNLYSARLVQLPEPFQTAEELPFGYLDRPDPGSHTGSMENGEEVLRWPKAPAVQGPIRLDWIPGYSPAQKAAQMASAGVREGTAPLMPFIPYRFKDLNPERPYLILNSASATEDDPQGLRFGDVFTFTREDFGRHLNSSIDDYDVAHGVMASCAFPGAFSFVTLRDFRPMDAHAGARYLHVFDGGAADNMGLTSARKIILENRDRYRHFVVLMVDSHVPSAGASRSKPDVRDRVIDLNFVNSFETLLDSVRTQELAEFSSQTVGGHPMAGKLTFWHMTFDDVRDPEIKAKAYRIATSFDISRDDIETVQQCVNDLVRPEQPKLQEVLRVLGVR
jgi:predicted acylesterase/phospholipase RssA